MKFSKHITPVKIAIVLALLLIVWLLIGDHKSALEDAPAEQEKAANGLAQVEVHQSQASLWGQKVVAQGQLEPWQQVAVKAQVNGRVDELLKRQGDEVKAGEVLLRLSDEGRSERLAQSKANLKLRERELANARSLEKSNFVAETEISRFESVLAEAKADLVTNQLAVQYSQPEAPFDGVVNRRYVDQGELVTPGTSLMDIVEVGKLKVTAHIPQQQVIELKVGQAVQLELLDGRTMQGEISFVSYSADEQTRAFYIEVATPNPEKWRISGASVTLRIQLPEVMVHRFSPALLSLNSQGQLGVDAVDEQNIVQFYPVRVLSVDNEAATVAGLPESIRLITLGAGFVEQGQQVEAVEPNE